jgi:O-antigen/teichoic acid export membrane protein
MGTEAGPSRRLSEETHKAARSAVQLGVSLFATWSVAVLVRLYLPRHLGPHAFGTYSFAEGFATTLMALLSLGVDSYTLRELPTRPGHASDYFGGMLVLRSLLGGLMLTGIVLALSAAGFDAETTRVTSVFALGYLVTGIAQLLAACLQANATVKRLAIVNVVAKLVWGAAIVVALTLRWPLELVAAAFVLSEALKAALLFAEATSRLGLSFRVDVAATGAVVVASLPYFANTVALNLNRLDVTVLGFMAGEEVVGWYGAASSFSLLVFMFAPLLGAVVLPMLARVRARSHADFLHVMGRLTQGLLVVATPLALMVALGADLWVRLAFGEAYLPAASSLRVMAWLALLSYLTSLLSMALLTLDQRWTVTFTSVVGLVINPLLCVLLIPVCARAFGAGGAGAGAALGVVGMELSIITLQLRSVGIEILGPRALSVAGRCLLAATAVLGLHLLTAGLGYWRLPLDAAAYGLAALALGVLPVRQLLGLAREVLASRRA